jgi:hypothetical protein
MILFISQRLTARPRGLKFELNLTFLLFITLLRRPKLISFMQIQYTVGFLLDITVNQFLRMGGGGCWGGGGESGWWALPKTAGVMALRTT